MKTGTPAHPVRRMRSVDVSLREREGAVGCPCCPVTAGIEAGFLFGRARVTPVCQRDSPTFLCCHNQRPRDRGYGAHYRQSSLTQNEQHSLSFSVSLYSMCVWHLLSNRIPSYAVGKSLISFWTVRASENGSIRRFIRGVGTFGLILGRAGNFIFVRGVVTEKSDI